MLEPAVRPVQDIYHLLGISPGASRLLAREMYWARMQTLHGQEDSPVAREEIEALNEALAIIMDDDLRRAYDATRPPDPPVERYEGVPTVTPRVVATRRDLKPLIPAVLTLIVVLSTVIIWPIRFPWTVAVIGIAVAITVICFLQSLPRHVHAGHFEHLRLLPGATSAEIDLAYRTRAQELLIELTRNVEALHDLDRLDRAYVGLMAAALVPATVSEAPLDPAHAQRRLPAVAPALIGALRATMAGAAALSGGAVRATGATAPLWKRAGHVGSRLRQAAVTSGRDAAQQLQDRRAPSAPPPSIDLEQRLAASFKASAIQIAEAAVPQAPAEAVVAAPSVWLLLTSAAGTRRVPVSDRPIRIGSAPECDLVLPERAGVSAEHAMIWRHGDAVILHVTDPQAECEVNGNALTWARLDDGDEVRVGSVTLRVAGA